MAIMKTKKAPYKNPRVEKMRKELLSPENRIDLSLTFDKALIKKFKMKTVADETTMTEILTKAIKEYLR